jgi:hypothetical protein
VPCAPSTGPGAWALSSSGRCMAKYTHEAAAVSLHSSPPALLFGHDLLVPICFSAYVPQFTCRSLSCDPEHAKQPPRCSLQPTA